MNRKYFEEIGKKIRETQKTKALLEREVREAIRDYGYGSKEVEEGYVRLGELQKIPSGIRKAYVSFRNGKGESVVLNTFVWEDEMEDFAKTLIDADVMELFLTDASTGLMDAIHLLADAGWKITGIVQINDKKGLRFER